MPLPAATSAPAPVAVSHGWLTTFAWTGGAVDTYTRLGLADGRAYVQLAPTSAALERIWNTGSARVAPCTPGGRPTGAPVEGEARVLTEEEAGMARRALGVSEEDGLYVEIASRER